MTVKPIPDGQRSITPHISPSNAAKAIEFYKAAFGAEEFRRSPGPGGKILHAELRIGDSNIFVCDQFGPPSGPPSGCTIALWVNDVDAVWKRAIAAGATVKMELGNMFWGDRYGQLVDPFGYNWSVSTHIEDLSPEEIARRGEEAMKQFGKKFDQG
jgi:PhnB protein